MTQIFIKIIMCICFFVSVHTNSLTKEKQEESKDKPIVTDIRKECYKNATSNIYEYILCINWSLTEEDIREVLTQGRRSEYDGDISLVSAAPDSWISANVIIEGITKRVKINAMSYYYVIYKKESQLYVFKPSGYATPKSYFIRMFTEADDPTYESKKENIKLDLTRLSTNTTLWKGTYRFVNAHGGSKEKYSLIIKPQELAMTIGSNKVACIPYVIDSSLYLYFNADNTPPASLKHPIIKYLQDGDFVGRVFVEQGKKYLQASSILKEAGLPSKNSELVIMELKE